MGKSYKITEPFRNRNENVYASKNEIARAIDAFWPTQGGQVDGLFLYLNTAAKILLEKHKHGIPCKQFSEKIPVLGR